MIMRRPGEIPGMRRRPKNTAVTRPRPSVIVASTASALARGTTVTDSISPAIDCATRKDKSSRGATSSFANSAVSWARSSSSGEVVNFSKNFRNATAPRYPRQSANLTTRHALDMASSYAMTRAQRLAAALLAGTLLGGLLWGCGGSTKKSKTTPVSDVPVTLTVGTIASPGAPATLSNEAQQAIQAILSRYVTAATAQALQTGTVGPGLDTVFDATAYTDATTGSGRGALIDDGFGTGTPTVQPVSAVVNGVTDTKGSVAVVTTTMTVNASSQTKSGPVTVTREATFVLHPDTWRIHAYDVKTTRTTPEGATTTSSAAR